MIEGAAFGTLGSAGERPIQIAVDRELDDPIGRALLDGTFYREPHHTLMMSLLRPGHRVLDLGAHLGTFSLPAAALGCDVIALEASSHNAALLRASATQNGFDNLRIVEAAVSDRPGTLEFCAGGPYGHVATPDTDFPKTSVRAITVDDLLAEVGWDRVDLVKIDVEGWELAVLRGMASLLSRADSPIVLYESNGHILRLREQTPAQLKAAFEEHGYRNYLINPGRLVPVNPGDLQPSVVMDYLAVKEPTRLPAGWGIAAPLGRDEIIARILADCAYPSIAHRGYAAFALRDAPQWLLDEPDIQSALRTLRADPEPFVHSVAAWSAP